MKMTGLSFLIFLLVSGIVSAQIKEFYLTCAQSDFDYIYANYEQDIYVPVTVVYNGTTWPDATMRIRGDGSRAFPKKSLKIKFNSAPFSDGRTSLNFNAEWEDRTYVQQVVASRIMRESGQTCFKAEHIRVHLNGAFLGLYVLVESVDDHFLSTRNMNLQGTLYKAWRDGSSMSIFDVPAYHWEQKEGPDLDMADLTDLIDGINEVPQSLFGAFANQHFDRVEMVNMIALNILFSLGSTYYHNYFMFHDPTSDKWSMLPWDMDKTLAYYGSGFPYQRTSPIWVPDNPYHEKAIQDEPLLTEIRQQIQALESSIFNSSYIEPIIDSIETVISASVAEDLTDDVSDVGYWLGEVSYYESRVAQRVSNVYYQMDEFPRSFTVERIETAEPGAQITLHWTPSVSPLQRPITYRLLMGESLDLENTASIIIDNLSDTSVQFTAPTIEGQYYYKVQSYDGFNYSNGFDTYNPIVITDNVPDLVINEINYHSSVNFDSGDWLELYNPLPYAVNLEDWYVKDNQNDHVFTFSSSHDITGEGYLVLCRGLVPFQSLNPNVTNVVGEFSFGLGNSGDAVRLFHPSGLLVDEVFYGDTLPWPAEADGNGPTLELNAPNLDNDLPENWTAWPNEHGTPGATNLRETGISSGPSIKSLSVYPNPSIDNRLVLQFHSASNEPIDVRISDVLGRIVYATIIRPDSDQLNTFVIRPNLRASGIYTVGLTSSSGLNTTEVFQHLSN